jgi:hypothetical protein
MANNDYRFKLQLADLRDGSIIQGSGGYYMVAQANTGKKQAIYDKNATQLNGTLAFLPLNFGNIEFYVPNTNAVDVFILAPDGQFVAKKGLVPSGPNNIVVDRGNPSQVAIVPWSATDATAATEKDTGLDLPVNALITPNVGIKVIGLEAAKTVDFGTLSTESSGDADGFMVAMSAAAAVGVLAKSASTATRGALIGAGTLDRGHVVVSGTQSLSFTTSSGAAAAHGYAILPYILPSIF